MRAAYHRDSSAYSKNWRPGLSAALVAQTHRMEKARSHYDGGSQLPLCSSARRQPIVHPEKSPGFPRSRDDNSLSARVPCRCRRPGFDLRLSPQLFRAASQVRRTTPEQHKPNVTSWNSTKCLLTYWPPPPELL